MKTISYILLLVMGLFAISCEKDPVDDPIDEVTYPTVQLSLEEGFNQDHVATLAVTLSTSFEEEVVVLLEEAELQTDKSKLPVSFPEEVTVPAGSTKVSIEVTANVDGLQPGDYQAAIKVKSAENAELGNDVVVYLNYTKEQAQYFTDLEVVEVLASDDFEDGIPWVNFDQDDARVALNNAMGGTREYSWSNSWGGACVHEGKSAVAGNNCLQLHWGGTVTLQGFTIDPTEIYQLELMVHPLGGVSGEWNNWAALHLFVFDQTNVWQTQGVRVRLSNNDPAGKSPALIGLDVWEGEEGAERADNLFAFSDKWQEYTVDDAADGSPSFWIPLKLVFTGEGTEDNPLVIDFHLNDKYIATRVLDDIHWFGDRMIGIQNSSDNEDLCRYDNFKLSVMRAGAGQ